MGKRCILGLYERWAENESKDSNYKNIKAALGDEIIAKSSFIPMLMT